MLGEPRIGLKPLATLCRRLATSLGAGVDVRTVWAREAAAAHGAGHSRFSDISIAVAQGTSIGDALANTGNYFPDFFRELVRVGEHTGHLPEVFRQLAEHYEHQLKLRRIFLGSIAWPTIELTLALTVVGVVIWLMAEIPALKKSGIDILGFGLSGNSGLVTYLTFLAIVGGAIFFVIRATMRGALWVAPVQRFLMAVPRLGRALETFAMARLTWAMHVTLNSGMDLMPAMKMSLESTHNVVYTRPIAGILSAIRAGQEVHEALGASGVFPVDFLDAVRVGEESGQLPESMGRLSAHYQDAARSAMIALAVLMGLAVWGVIAAVIIFLIFRVFGMYLQQIENISKGKF